MILTIDTTQEPTPSWSALSAKFYDGNPSYGGTLPALAPERRDDQLFWDYDSGPRRTCAPIASPASPPNTVELATPLPPSRLAPCTPPVSSPAA